MERLIDLQPTPAPAPLMLDGEGAPWAQQTVPRRWRQLDDSIGPVTAQLGARSAAGRPEPQPGR